MMFTRWLSGIVLVVIAITVTWFGIPVFSVFIAAVAGLGILEFYRMTGISIKQPLAIFGIIGVLLFIFVAHLDDTRYTAILLTSAVILTLILSVLKSDIEKAAVNWAWIIVGMIYIGWMLSHFIPLRGMENGRDWVLLAVIANVASDTAALHIGLKWGRRRTAPRISPSKTWEGTIGGFIAAVAAVMLLAYALPTLDIPYWQAAILGILIGIFAPLGDLAESLLKRSTGVKDSGSCVPGHGGILDRLDSMLFTVVVVYYYVTWVAM